MILALGVGFAGVPHARSQPLPDRRSLVGHIARADGAPIGSAAITFRRQNDADIAQFWGTYAVTDARGRFALPNVEDGAYFVDVDADGYAPERNHAYVVDATAPALEITLARLAPLLLHVLKPDGAPLSKTRVYMRFSGEGPASPRLPAPVTDDAGKLRFDTTNNDNPNCPTCSLVPSRYLVNLIVPGIGFAVLRDLDVEYTSNPQAVEVRLQVGGALRVTAHDDSGAGDKPGRAWGGALLSMTPTLSEDTASRAAGKLRSPEDIARFYTMQRDPSGASLVTRDGDGTIELADLPPANYKIRLFAPGQDSPEAQAVEIKPGQTATADFIFKRPDAAAELALTVNNPQGRVLPDTNFIIQLRDLSRATVPDGGGAPPPLPPDAPPGAMGMFYNGYLRRARTDANGHLNLYPLKPGKWRVTLMQPYESYSGGRGFAPPAIQDVTVPAQGAAATMTVSNGPSPLDKMTATRR